MFSRKQTALQLRLSGKSYSEIQKIIKVSKSTLSLWFRDVVLSDQARIRIGKRSAEKSRMGLLRRNRLQTDQARQRALAIEQSASTMIGKLTPENLILLGAALYWAEGYKKPIIRNGKTTTSHPISLTNSDPLLVKCFLEFLKICQVPEDKIKIDIRVFQHMNPAQILDFWIDATGLPREQFKTRDVGISRSSMNKRPYNRLPHGVVQVRINNTQLFHRIIGWINGVKSQLPR